MRRGRPRSWTVPGQAGACPLPRVEHVVHSVAGDRATSSSGTGSAAARKDPPLCDVTKWSAVALTMDDPTMDLPSPDAGAPPVVDREAGRTGAGATPPGLAALAGRVHAVAHLTGTFTLRSGRTATEYFDKYRFEADPELLDALAAAMVPLVPAGTEVLAGLEMGGIPVVTALSRHTGLPAAFVRKQAKAYGTARLAEGAEVSGRRVTVVEDVVTSGGQVVLSTADLRALGATVGHALCVIDRGEGGGAALASEGIELVALLTRGLLDQAAEGTPGPSTS